MAAKKKTVKKKTARKKVAKKKAAARKTAVKRTAVKKTAVKKKAVKKKAAKKKVVARKKAAAPKKAATKKTATKKAAPKRAAAKPAKPKSAAPAKRPARKVTAKAPAKATPDTPLLTSAAVVDAVLEEPPHDAPEASPPANPATDRAAAKTRGEARDTGRSAEDAQPVRRARVIPPLPDDDEEYVPFDGDVAAPKPRVAPADVSPETLLEQVRAGALHVSVLDELSDRDVRTLARRGGLRVRRNERRKTTLRRLVERTTRGDAADPGPAPRPRKEAPAAAPREQVYAEGLLEMHPDGYGFLRRTERSYQQHPTDVYVSVGLIRKHGLKPGHWISGYAERPNPAQPQLALKSLDHVNHGDVERLEGITPFEQLTVVYPDQRFILETAQEDLETRVLDLFCPLGMGQRGLIVAPPRTGKTVLLTKLADAIAINSPEVDIVVLLIDERPEEVTNMRRSVKGEVIASTFDKPAGNHVRVAELVMEKVKRMVEFGRDVVLLLDSITRMGRAYNNQTGGSGRLLSGGLDANALTKPKRFFGSARNVEGGGSLTIIATALIDTGSRMDEVIFEEFKGTGNMEIVLDRDMANNRVWPAIDLPSSGTRNEDLLLHPDELRRVAMLRRGITGQEAITVMMTLRKQLLKFRTNAEFLLSLGG